MKRMRACVRAGAQVKTKARAADGFMILELLITLAIVVVIAVAVFVNLNGGNNAITLTDTTKQVAALLREAQSDAMAQKNGTAWGVHFENATTTTPFYALFGASSYSTSTIVGQYILPANISYTAATLAPGATLDVIFSSVTGAPNAPATIGLSVPTQTAIPAMQVTVSSAGAVSY